MIQSAFATYVKGDKGACPQSGQAPLTFRLTVHLVIIQ